MLHRKYYSALTDNITLSYIPDSIFLYNLPDSIFLFNLAYWQYSPV